VVFNEVAAVVAVFVVGMIEEAVAVVVFEVEGATEGVVFVVAVAVDFEVAEDVATDIEKKLFLFCLLLAIFCMAILIIVAVFSTRYIHKTHNMKQKYTKRMFSEFNVELVLIK
jgi:hypothetical protein